MRVRETNIIIESKLLIYFSFIRKALGYKSFKVYEPLGIRHTYHYFARMLLSVIYFYAATMQQWPIHLRCNSCLFQIKNCGKTNMKHLELNFIIAPWSLLSL
jgi:hypothetical protein